jgi:hypothetical protein
MALFPYPYRCSAGELELGKGKHKHATAEESPRRMPSNSYFFIMSGHNAFLEPSASIFRATTLSNSVFASCQQADYTHSSFFHSIIPKHDQRKYHFSQKDKACWEQSPLYISMESNYIRIISTYKISNVK